jgi:hypothetical protein
MSTLGASPRLTIRAHCALPGTDMTCNEPYRDG